MYISDSSLPLASPQSSGVHGGASSGEGGGGEERQGEEEEGRGFTAKARAASFKLRKLSRASYSSPTEKLPLKNKVKMKQQKRQQEEEAAAAAAVAAANAAAEVKRAAAVDQKTSSGTNAEITEV